MSRIKDSLLKLFKEHRILMWYDAEKQFTEEWEALDLDAVQKIEVSGNEFAVKCKILSDFPKDKFILYLPYARPNDEQNWLFDIEETNHVFLTDQSAMFLQDLDLPINSGTREWVNSHIEFFKAKDRLNKLKTLIRKSDKINTLTEKMCQVALSADTQSVEDLLRVYAIAMADESDERISKDLERFNLTQDFWKRIVRHFWKRSGNEEKQEVSLDGFGIYDFLIELFRKNLSLDRDRSKLNESAIVLLDKWKDIKSFSASFEIISKKIEHDLAIEDKIESLSIDDLIKDDLYEIIDHHLIVQLASMLANTDIEHQRIKDYIKLRSNTYWYGKYQYLYASLMAAANFKYAVQQFSTITCENYFSTFKNYTEEWYQVDMYYRQFLESYRLTNQHVVLSTLSDELSKIYSNKWLLGINEKWQHLIDSEKEWYLGNKAQRNFFSQVLKPRYLDKQTKVFVIISDALRYECGRELHEKINKEQKRLGSELDYQVTGLPSYTQLGMAALLPHKEISFGEGDDILLDGKSTKGLAARAKILADNMNARATAILAEELMKIPSRSNAAKDLVQNHDVVYIYHNRIDKVGDDKTSEDKLVDSVREEINFLIEVVKKVANMNGNHVVVTSDHGFIYQHDLLDQSDFLNTKIEGQIAKDTRRYVIGNNLSANENFMLFSANDLQIQSEVDVLIPKGINRLRKQGSGSRYVHGGASLLETVTPILYIQRKREDTLREVEIDIINLSNNRITTNIHRVQFYQKEAVKEQIVPTEIKAYFAIIEEENVSEIISNTYTHTFDSESNLSTDREESFSFSISSSVTNSQNVYLCIETRLRGTVQWELTKKHKYSISIAMGRDFDFF